MYFIISALLKPIIVLLFLLILAAWFYYRKKSKIFRYLIFGAMIWFFIISTPFVPDYLVGKLENKYPPLSDKALPVSGKGVKIMVMGGGHVNDFRLSYNNQLTQNALGRLVEGIRLYKKLPGSKLILSGWGYDQSLTQAQTLALTSLSLGVPRKDIILYNNTENTSGEVKEYAKNSNHEETLYVVTNASHMPRVMEYFKKYKINPIPVPCNYSVKINEDNTFTYYFPESRHIVKSEKVMHEYLGILASYFE